MVEKDLRRRCNNNVHIRCKAEADLIPSCIFQPLSKHSLKYNTVAVVRSAISATAHCVNLPWCVDYHFTAYHCVSLTTMGWDKAAPFIRCIRKRLHGNMEPCVKHRLFPNIHWVHIHWVARSVVFPQHGSLSRCSHRGSILNSALWFSYLAINHLKAFCFIINLDSNVVHTMQFQQREKCIATFRPLWTEGGFEHRWCFIISIW